MKLKTLILSGLCVVMIHSSLSAAGLDAHLNQREVALGEVFQLTLTSSETSGEQPCLSILGKDFDIVGSSKSVQQQIINGQHSQQINWTYSLLAKREGRLQIPKIKAGKLSSEGLQIDVLPLEKMPKAMGVQGVSLQVSVEEGEHYLYQEIPLTLRIESAVALQSAELTVPQHDDVEIRVMGDDKVWQERRNNQQIQVIERKYSVKANTTGQLKLSPFVLRGAVAQARPHRAMGVDPFSMIGFDTMFSRAKPFQVRSEITNIDIIEAPITKVDGWFLPAKAVELSAQWQQKTPKFIQGEAVVRKIRLTALGASTEQLPHLTFDAGDHFKIYVDDTDNQQLQTDEGTVAQQTTWLSVVPTARGELELPEIKVRWFNTQLNREEVALIAAQKLQVAPAKSSVVTHFTAKPAILSKAPNTASNKTPNARQASPLWWWLALLVIVSGASIYGFKRFKRRAQHRTKINHKSLRAGRETARESSFALLEQQHLSKLQQAIKQSDTPQVYSALLQWLRTKQDREIDALFTHDLQILEQQLYNHNGDDSVKIDLGALRRHLKVALSVRGNSKKDSRQLPQLYPH